MEKNVWLTAVFGAALASSGLTAVVLLGLGLNHDTPRGAPVGAQAVSTAKIEDALERILERLEAMSLQQASAPAAVAPNRVALDQPADVSGLAEEIALLRSSLHQSREGVAARSSMSLAIERAQSLSPASLDALRLLGDQQAVRDQLSEEYRLRPAVPLFERFGRPTYGSVADNGVVSWKWYHEGSPGLTVEAHDGLVLRIGYSSRD